MGFKDILRKAGSALRPRGERRVQNIIASIENLEYQPLLCGDLTVVSLKDFSDGNAFSHASFVLDLKHGKIAVSRWVSAKRTRSYPFARVYDTMNYKTRVTIIPLVKDEGKEGDRDYLQWDTISLMSLLGVYVIIGYYVKAEKSRDYDNKITNQQFDYVYLKQKLNELMRYKFDALHWNLKQLSEIDQMAKKCEDAYYKKISKICKVELHGLEGFRERIKEISTDVKTFMDSSRELARSAQRRESLTTQPKERVTDEKATITITNYIGGKYYFTVDEATIVRKTLFLIEKKHSHTAIPSLVDIQDGLIKMVLYTNLSRATIDGKEFKVKPVLGLTSDHFEGFCKNAADLAKHRQRLSDSDFEMLSKLFKEAEANHFAVFLMSASDEKQQNEFFESLA